ncbi:CRE-ACR-15 protein [Caenorhabditis remanei]|uniref:CRE-ACR-15 protein n=1 Tax=Caenorhabditis remanei TaxID=31234 RepID=E3LZW6_CAERE|nr:CRE-ACR-15 protein [Caenorhabditis remanei]
MPHSNFILLQLLLLITQSNGSPAEVRLINDLMSGYVREERPILDSSKPVKVTLGVSLQQIINLSEKEEQLEVNAWLKFSWRDENLRWEPTAYENVTDLRHPPDALWTPDILLYNSVDSEFDSSYKVNLVNYHTGYINWMPPGIFKVSCKLDIYWFPFDEQICYFKFGSWTYTRDKIELEKGDFDFSEFIPNGEWIIIGHRTNITVKQYECCPEQYEDITFTLHLRRRTLYYSFNLIAPVLLTMVLVILGFTVSPETCEKVGLQISVSLAICIFLTIMSELTPQTSEAVPLLGVFFHTCNFISVLATSFTVYVQSFHFRNQHVHERMGFWMRFILLEWSPWVLRMKMPDRDNNVKTLKDSWKERNRRESMARTAFEYADGPVTQIHTMGIVLKENFEELIYQVKQDKTADEKGIERLRVLQKIYDHVKMIREHDDDNDEDSRVALEWRFAAIVVDRLCLLAFSILIVIVSIIIAWRAPYLFA